MGNQSIRQAVVDKCLFLLVKFTEAFVGANPDIMRCIFGDGISPVARNAIVVFCFEEILETITIITADAIHGANPEVSIVILKDRANPLIGQSVGAEKSFEEQIRQNCMVVSGNNRVTSKSGTTSQEAANENKKCV